MPAEMPKRADRHGDPPVPAAALHQNVAPLPDQPVELQADIVDIYDELKRRLLIDIEPDGKPHGHGPQHGNDQREPAQQKSSPSPNRGEGRNQSPHLFREYFRSFRRPFSRGCFLVRRGLAGRHGGGKIDLRKLVERRDAEMAQK